MKRGMTRWFAIVVALQAAFIVAEWGKYTVQAETGQKVVLKVVPVDPRSLFMGNYMALDFEAARFDPRRYGAHWDSNKRMYDRYLYVGLEPRSPYARIVSVSESLPTERPDGVVYIRGKVITYGSTNVVGSNQVNAVHLDYGISRYYFPEDRQQELLERTRWRPGQQPVISATVAVTDSGEAILRKLHINGETVEF